MVTTKWTYRKERSFASNYFIIIIIIIFYLFIYVFIFWKFCSNRVDLLYQQPKWPYLYFFVSAGVSFDGAFSSWVSLITSVYFSICFIYLFI